MQEKYSNISERTFKMRTKFLTKKRIHNGFKPFLRSILLRFHTTFTQSLIVNPWKFREYLVSLEIYTTFIANLLKFWPHCDKVIDLWTYTSNIQGWHIMNIVRIHSNIVYIRFWLNAIQAIGRRPKQYTMGPKLFWSRIWLLIIF